jgi:hypothetical protein
MASDFFNMPPQGFDRGANGWLRIAQTPQKRRLNKIQQENLELKDRLEALESVVSQIASKKNVRK